MLSRGDQVICPLEGNPGQYFEARVRRMSTENGEERAYVHYRGYNSMYDAWLSVTDILPFNDDNARLVTSYEGESVPQVVREGMAGPSMLIIPSSEGKAPIIIEPPPPPPKEIEEIVDAFGEGLWEPLPDRLELQMPDELCAILTADDRAITMEGRLLNYPREFDYYSVDKLVLDFLLETLTFDDGELMSGRRALYLQFAKGLLSCFNMFFEDFLLYPEEMEQYAALAAGDRVSSCLSLFDSDELEASSPKPEPDKKGPFVPSRVYGAEHLLRFFVKAPLLLSAQSVSPTQLSLLINKMQDVLEYCVMHKKKLFGTSRYTGPDPSPVDWADIDARAAVTS